MTFNSSFNSAWSNHWPTTPKKGEEVKCGICGKDIDVENTRAYVRRGVIECLECSQHITEPIVNTEAKVERNMVCPCGSGKKYKKCCGKK